MTARERLSVHSSVPTCRGCHALTDPIGLGLENFDGAGQFRLKDYTATIVASASGAMNKVAFYYAAGLGKIVRDDPALRSCVVNRLYGYSTGRVLKVAGDMHVSQIYAGQSGSAGATVLMRC